MARLVPDDVWAVLTIWQEARGESFAGMLGVAEVIQNRTRRRFQSDGTVVGTCLMPYQFSGWNSKDPNRLLAARLDDTDLVVQRCQRAWRIVQDGGSTITSGAVFYHAQSLKEWPSWAVIEHFTIQIGNHRFYTG